MNVLLLGSGGREHAFAWKLSQSADLKKLWIAPGNAGTALCGQNVNISPVDFDKIRQFVIANKINMVIVGPEDPLVKGIADYFINDIKLQNVKLIGPCKKGAMLEGSKDFAKDFMNRHHIPTAKHRTFFSENFSDGNKLYTYRRTSLCIKSRRFGCRQRGCYLRRIKTGRKGT